MSDDPIHFLLNDAKAASRDGDFDTQMFSMLQIFKLCEQENRGKTPSPAQVQMVVDLMREHNITPEQMNFVMQEIYRRFGEERPKPF
jgi:hypothetical protein